jgi:ribosome biogenesis protein ERB1
MSAFDRNLQAEKPLSANELDIIRRLYAGENPDEGYDPYEPTIEWFTGKGKEEIMPLSAAPEPKRRFVPSKWEKQKVFNLLASQFGGLKRRLGHENSASYQARPHPPQ